MRNKLQLSAVHELGNAVFMLFILQLLGGVLMSTQRTFFPLYASSIGLAPSAIATIHAVRQIGGLLSSLLGGYMSDRLGRKKTYLIGNISFLLGCAVFIVPSPAAVSLFWILCGFGMGLRALGGQSYLVEAAPAKYLGVSSALYTWGTTLGGAVGSPIAGLILDRSGYSAFGVALVGVAVAAIVLNAFGMPAVTVSKPTVRPSVRGMFGYKTVAGAKPVKLLTMLRFFPTIYWGMALILIPLMLDAAGASTMLIATYAAVSQVVASVCQIIVGRATDKRGFTVPAYVVASTLVASIAGTAIFAHSVAGLFVAGTMGASAAWSMSALVPVFASAAAPPDQRGRVLGWVHLWWNMGMIVGAWISGILFEVSPALPFAVAAVLNVALVPLLRLFGKAVRGVENGDRTD